MTLLDFVQDELAELPKLKAQRDAADAEARKIASAAATIQDKIDLRRHNEGPVHRQAILVQAALDGKPLPPEPPPPPGASLSDLELALMGLEEKQKQAEERVAELHGKLRTKVFDLFPLAAERAAAAYLEAAQRLGELHAAIGACNHLRTSFEPLKPLVGQEWMKVLVPSSGLLRTLEGRGLTLNFQTVLYGGSEEGTTRGAVQAYQAAKASITALLGEWPLGR
ncbi:MAG: hypothetical protein QM767_11570 [Anaeromyxobacter sp.]